MAKFDEGTPRLDIEGESVAVSGLQEALEMVEHCLETGYAILVTGSTVKTLGWCPRSEVPTVLATTRRDMFTAGI